MRGKEKDLAVAVVLAARCALSRNAKRGGTDLVLAHPEVLRSVVEARHGVVCELHR